MSPSHPVNRHDELRALLERLNLGGMAAVFADLALKATKENLSLSLRFRRRKCSSY